MIDWKALAAPLPEDAIEWRVGQVARNGKSATLLAYLTARAVMDRLDDVVGPDRWRDEYREGPGGGVLCGLSLRVGDEWITKWDAAENTQIEAVKGGISDALKRAAVRWGIGRYLYRLGETREQVTEGWPPRGVASVPVSWTDGGKDRKYGWAPRPTLPTWALPAPAEKPAKARREESAEREARQAGHHPSWAGARAGFCARLGEAGVEYDLIAAYCEAQGWGRPSAWSAEKRTRWLAKADEMIEAAQRWHAEAT